MNILIADDDPVSRRMLEKTLVKLGHQVVGVGNGLEAMDVLEHPDAPQLAILDWMMPRVDGLSACRAIRSREDGPYVYIILLTAREGRDSMVEALEAGVDDFLTKPFDVVELRARLRSGDRVIGLQDGLLRAQEALRLEATRDHLTGLWNRRAVFEQLRRELRRAKHELRPVAVLLADIDNFKGINDGYGHAAGDEVLRQVAGRMVSVVRDYDFVGRYGGEEFLFVLPGCNGATSMEVAERVRNAIARDPVRLSMGALRTTVSIGIAWTRGTEQRVDSILEAADAALYCAKATGKDRIVTGGER